MIQIKKDVLSLNLIKDIKQYIAETKIHKSSYLDWDQSVVRQSAPVFIHDLNKTFNDVIIKEVLKKFNLDNNVTMDINYFGWTKLSYIPWHDDSQVDYGMTIYLNETWHPDWGGFFAYVDNNEIKCIQPEYNKGILLTAPTKHCVFTTNLEAPIRETIQIFIRKI